MVYLNGAICQSLNAIHQHHVCLLINLANLETRTESHIYRNIWGVIPNNVTKYAPQSNIVLGDLQRELDKARELVGKGLEYLIDEPHGIEHAVRDLESINDDVKQQVPECHLYLAELYRKQGFYQKAVITYEKFFSISTKADPEINPLFYSAKLNQLIAM